jgi:hypothetical protein
MSEVVGPARSYHYVSAREIREQKKKALQSYQHISTIQTMAEKEEKESQEQADKFLELFISSIPQEHGK